MTFAKNLGVVLTASALVFSTAAQAATRSAAAMPSTTSAENVELVRSAAPVVSENELEGESGILIALLVAAAVIAGIIIIADDNDSPG